MKADPFIYTCKTVYSEVTVKVDRIGPPEDTLPERKKIAEALLAAYRLIVLSIAQSQILRNDYE